MVKLANALLNVRYLLYAVIISLSVVLLSLIIELGQNTVFLLFSIFEFGYEKVLHQALVSIDICLVIVLVINVSNYILFEYIITKDKEQHMPAWATELSRKYDSTKLKSSISVTVGAIFLIFILGKIIDPDQAAETGAMTGADLEWFQLGLYSILIVSVLVVSISAWIAGRK